jgi:hypothetical protein
MIPARAQFIWIGDDFPWLNFAAVASAARRGGFEQLIVHHSDELGQQRHFRALERIANVEARRLDAEAVIEAAAGPRLVDRYRMLLAPAARSNVLRLALLRREGGVYLDFDTVTCRDLGALRAETGFFCGAERIAFPASLEERRNPLAWGGAYLRSALRDLARRSASGVTAFRRIERHYATCVNNAVIGARADHPLLAELCERMLALPEKRAVKRYALGTSLLQNALSARAEPDYVVHAPEVFYPLAPEISEHWFRSDSKATLAEVVSEQTRVVHWYASVRTREIAPRIDPEFMRGSSAPRLITSLLEEVLGYAPRSSSSVSPNPRPSLASASSTLFLSSAGTSATPARDSA